MNRITVGRYGKDGICGYAGYIEGVRADGSEWIVYLDVDGNPVEYFPNREPDGAAIGDPVLL